MCEARARCMVARVGSRSRTEVRHDSSPRPDFDTPRRTRGGRVGRRSGRPARGHAPRRARGRAGQSRPRPGHRSQLEPRGPAYRRGSGRVPRREHAGHPRPRRVMDDLEGRASVHLQAQERRQVPRRHAAERRGGEVLHRAADQYGASRLQARQVSLCQLQFRERQGGRGAERRARRLPAQGAARLVSRHHDVRRRVHREPHRRDEVGPRLSESSRGHRPLPLRVVGPRPARRAREESRPTGNIR